MTSKILLYIDPCASKDDVEAFLSSYAVVLNYKGKELLRGPAYGLVAGLGLAGGISNDPQAAGVTRAGQDWPPAPPGKNPPMLIEEFPPFDRELDLRLVRDGESGARWPFFVDAPLKACFMLGQQWWEYGFTPGKLYEERFVEYGDPQPWPKEIFG